MARLGFLSLALLSVQAFIGGSFAAVCGFPILIELAGQLSIGGLV